MNGVPFNLAASPVRVTEEPRFRRCEARVDACNCTVVSRGSMAQSPRPARRTAAMPAIRMAAAEPVAHQNARDRAGRIQSSMRA